jgi:predicted nuclease of restriction endonuclease-like (RecB) superfamily
MEYNLLRDKEYRGWLISIKAKVRGAQLKAAVKVNTELLALYWEIGADIVAKQKNTKWGEGFLLRLSKDLMAEFPEMKGFSRRNLELIRQWYLFYSANTKQTVSQFSQQAVGQIPWGHNIAIISKCKNINEAIYYVQNTIKHNWSRSVLVHQIESGLFKREGKAVHNFSLTLPKPQSDLAVQTIKNPYIFDFLSMRKNYDERDLEAALVDHVTQFLLELGAGFAYLGRQVSLKVGGQEFFIDLLFYHTKLRCYVAIELKTSDFMPEHAGKLNFYLTAVDRQLRTEGDRQSVGILLCKKKNKVVAEYALSDINKPIGISQYKLTNSLPKKFKLSLPTIKEIEDELSGG